MEACESGSMFEGLLPEGLNIYATTVANAVEDSYGTYCLDDYSYTPLEYDTCLGDLYSDPWMEDRYVYFLTKILVTYCKLKYSKITHQPLC